MTMVKIQLTRKNEKGIALLFTLIMLSLLLILALSFALDSMFSQKAAYNSASSSSAALLAKSQLKQVFALIEASEANYDTDFRVYSHDLAGVDSTDMLKTRLPVHIILPEDDPCLAGTPPNVKWNYVRNANNKIIGRTAFVVVPDVKIPLDSLVDGRDDLAGSTYPKHSEELNSETRIGKYVSEINVRAAIPAVTSNIDTITRTLNWPVSGDVGFTGGAYPNPWASYSSLFTSLETAIGSALPAADKTEIEDKLSIDIEDDKEAFWADLDNNKEINDDNPSANEYELFKRFDLTRADWNTPSVSFDHLFVKYYLLLIGTASVTTAPDQEMDTWNSSPSGSASYGLPWLACFGYKADGTPYTGADLDKIKGTFTDAATDAENIYNRRCQIAANLKDYCDNDNDRPTSDVNPATWATTAPSYTGNERTPYINKVGVRVETTRTETNFAGTDYTNITTIVKPVVGLINIYGKDFANLRVTISGTATIAISKDGGSSYPFSGTDTFNQVLDFNTGNWVPNNGHSDLVIGGTTMVSDRIVESGTGAHDQSIMIKVSQVVIDRVVLHHETTSDAYDYVKTLTLTSGFTAFPDSKDPSTQVAWAGWAVHDPRQNLNAGDWQELTSSVAPIASIPSDDDNPSKTFSIVVGDPPYECAPNSQNSLPANGGGTDTEAPTAGPDLETAADPGDCALSTAYIRNAPMESPWELGFIHRGAKWETLNLKKYDASKAIKTFTIGSYSYIAGGGLYADGDANILDQVKMTADAASPQKITLKAPQNKIFDALFSKVKCGCTIARSSTPADHMTVSSMAGLAATPTGTELSTTEITNLGSGIINKYRIAADSNMWTRASVVDKLLLSATTTPSADTDAKQEELIGKIINLTKIEAQKPSGVTTKFSVIVLAQTINDIGGTGGNTINIQKYSVDGTTIGNEDCAIGTFDADTSATDPDKHIYFDEITGEQKILVTCKSTTSGIVITSFKYIE